MGHSGGGHSKEAVIAHEATAMCDLEREEKRRGEMRVHRMLCHSITAVPVAAGNARGSIWLRQKI